MPFIVVREFIYDCTRQGREIARRRHMIFGRQSCRVAKVTGVHAQCRCVLVHHFRKHTFGAGDVLCQRYACIVSGLHDHA